MPSVAPSMAYTLLPSAISTKRKRSPDASSRLSPLSAKRPKVAFDSDVEVKLFDSGTERTTALVVEEIRQAIRKHAAGDDEDYAAAKQLLCAPLGSDDCATDRLLRKYLVGLTNNVSLLDRKCADLVHAALACQWLAREDAVVGSYTRFLGNLLSSQGGYLSNVLKMMVDNFAHISLSAGAHSDIGVSRSKCQARLHASLQYVLSLIPSASGVLASIISSSFPFPTDTTKAHVEYVRNLLKLSEYAPEIKAEILDLITERLIKIDVQVQIDVEDFEEDIGELLVQSDGASSQRHSSSLGPPGTHPDQQREDEKNDDEEEAEDDDDASDVSSVDSDDSIDTETQRIQSIRSSVEKLDALLDILLTHLAPTFELRRANSSGTSSPASKKSAIREAQSTYNLLLAQFRKTVLPTYRSRHTQFLVFHFAQSSPSRATAFIDSCLSVLEDKCRSNVSRVSAAAYIASFAARAARVDAATISYTFDRLAAYLERLAAQYEAAAKASGPDLRRYAPYYAAFQALMYIFCFRWRSLTRQKSSHRSGADGADDFSSSSSSDELDVDDDDADDDDDIDDDGDGGGGGGAQGGARGIGGGERPSFLPHVKPLFGAASMSPLNPLKVCAPEVVEEFVRTTFALRLMYLHHVVERNKRIRLAEGGGGGGMQAARETSLSKMTGERFKQLDAYFPFDPYRLPRSRRWVDGEYLEYRGSGRGAVVLAAAAAVESAEARAGGEQESGPVAGQREEKEEEEEAEEGVEEGGIQAAVSPLPPLPPLPPSSSSPSTWPADGRITEEEAEAEADAAESSGAEDEEEEDEEEEDAVDRVSDSE